MKNLELKVLLNTVDKATAPLKNITKGANRLAQEIGKMQGRLEGFNKVKVNAEKFAQARKNANEFAKSLTTAKANTEQLQKALTHNETQLKSSFARLGPAAKKVEQYKSELSALKMIYKTSSNQVDRGQAKAKIAETRTALKGLRANLKAYKAEYKRLNQANKSLTQSFESEKNALNKLNEKYSQSTGELKKLQGKLRQAGFKTTHFSQSQTQLKNDINKTNTALSKQKIWLEKINKLSSIKNNIVNKFQGAQSFAHYGIGAAFAGRSIFAQLSRVGGGVVNMTKTASQFEKFQSILEVTEGSAEKAKKSMDWVKQFSIETPFNLEEVMDSFVKLRAYGLDPTNGLLKTLGDTGAAMGKPIMQAVEAIADAVAGENERLKEFGIKARAVGNNFEYEYTDKNGIQQVAKVNKNNRAKIEKTLTAIFNKKYAGAMKKQSETLGGILSNLEDHWINFQMLVMSSGAFDWIKTKLKGVLDKLDEMKNNGELQKWAEDVGAVIKDVAKGLWDIVLLVVKSVKFFADLSRENKGLIASFIKWGRF
ncbi:hypothetical protein GVX81_10410 [[Haemophilus] felis]|nr:hypothetical protein [[Haemophilus] felis]NBI41467.1 hypothetical protein [[Haemophilus] felis]